MTICSISFFSKFCVEQTAEGMNLVKKSRNNQRRFSWVRRIRVVKGWRRGRSLIRSKNKEKKMRGKEDIERKKRRKESKLGCLN